jgi:molybdopterin synthase catalytic subunit
MIRVQVEDFKVEEEIGKVKARSKKIGGIVTFLGVARDHSKGHEVEKLVFEHYPGMAEKKLAELRDAALRKFDIIEALIIHRTGEILPGENIVLIVVGAEHRVDAFSGCSWIIDELKKSVPIWKHEFSSSGDHWVEDHP